MIILEVVTFKGKPIGLVAATSKSHIGYALYNSVKEKRRWNLGLATTIATGRADDLGIDPMDRLFEISEMFRLMEIAALTARQLEVAKGGLARTFLMTKAVMKMIVRAKKVRW